MSRFHELKVKRVKRETNDCVSLSFEVPEGIKEEFTFNQGQFLTFKKTLDNGEEIRRSYSICSAPHEGELSVAVKHVRNGIFSTYANTLVKEGDVLEAMPPSGRFMGKFSAGTQKEYLAIAAGSGITPVISIIKTILQTQPDSSVHLLYGNKDRNSIIFKEQLESLKNKYLGRLSLYFILSRETADAAMFSGRINKEKIANLFKYFLPANNISEAFLCGPEEMILEVKDYLLANGLQPGRVHFELFAAAGAQKTFGQQTQGEASHELANVAVTLDGSTVSLTMPYDGESILDAAMRNGADLPYACKGGVCATCRAKLLKGKVHMDVAYGLEPEELAAGFILTCQSHPRSAEIAVNFDIK
ncbi:MAG: phenylacetate-CoA oxygenase/reductase subunit PaaK [Edaphocola sp.]